MNQSFAWRKYIFGAAILIAYLAFLTRTYYWDGVLFSLNIEGVKDGRSSAIALFHPNHLVYNAVGYMLYTLAVRLWPGIRAITVLQLVNVCASVLAGYLVGLIGARISKDKCVGLFCWLLFAAGATWWKFSTDANAYILAVLLLLLATWLLLRSKPNLVGAALCHAAAMLFHELAVFSYIPVLTWLLLDPKRLVGQRLGVAAAYCVGTGTLVAGSYWLCFAMAANHTAYPTFFSWITSYASDSSFTHSVSDLFVRYPLSYLKLFAGGKPSLVRQFFSVWECVGFGLCAVSLVLGFRAWGKRQQCEVAENRSIVFLWAWLLSYAVFLAAWDPGSAFHKLFVWPPIVLLVGLYARRRVEAATYVAAALAAWNFGAFIYPHSRGAADPVLVLSKKINTELPRNATVYYRVLDPDDWYLEYFAPGRQWKPLPMDGNPHGPVCLETTALSDFHGALDPNLKWDLVNSAHNVRLECLASKK